LDLPQRIFWTEEPTSCPKKWKNSRLWGSNIITPQRTTPQTNDLCEQQNATIKATLRAYVENKDQEEWDLY